MANYVDYASATELFTDVGNSFTAIEGKIPSNASSSNKMVTASDIASKADLVDGKVPSSQLPSYVDDVLEYSSISEFPATGESGKIYVALDTNKTYRWGGSDYVEISESLALGETSSTAYAGDKGKANADAISAINDLIPSGATTSNKLATASDLADKVDKVTGKGLSTNDYTTADQTALQTTIPLEISQLQASLLTKADVSSVPTALSDLTDDSTHRVVTDTEKTTWSGKQDALTFDNVPTANSNNPVKSGGIKTALDDKMSYADNGVLGAKNWIPFPYNEKTKTQNGVTFTVNSDTSITISTESGNPASADAYFTLLPNTDKYNDKDWILSGCAVGGSASTYNLYMRVGNSQGGYIRSNVDTGSGILIDSSIRPSGTNLASIGIVIKKDTDLSTPVIFYPMLRLATDPDSTYQPYAMTNRELTEERPFSYKLNTLSGMTGGTTAYDSGIKIPQGTYAVFANLYLTTGGVIVLKINEVDTVVDRNAPSPVMRLGHNFITYDGNTNMIIRCSGDTNAVIGYGIITFIKLKEAKTIN